jgi:hypothetical protein
MPQPFIVGPALWRRTCGYALLTLSLLGLSASANAAPWRSHFTLPSGDEVQLRTGGLRVKPSGSRGEIDLPVRVRFAKPVDGPAGPVDMVDAKVRMLCKEGTVSASAVRPRHADGKLLATKDFRAAASAARTPLLQVLSSPAVVDSLCSS